MSIRRRAIRERVERTRKREEMFARWKSPNDPVNRLLALTQRKIEAGDTSLTEDEMRACFAEPTNDTHG
jgi:hypothetical protein